MRRRAHHAARRTERRVEKRESNDGDGEDDEEEDDSDDNEEDDAPRSRRRWKHVNSARPNGSAVAVALLLGVSDVNDDNDAEAVFANGAQNGYTILAIGPNSDGANDEATSICASALRSKNCRSGGSEMSQTMGEQKIGVEDTIFTCFMKTNDLN